MTPSFSTSLAQELSSRLAHDPSALLRVIQFMSAHPERVAAIVTQAIDRAPLRNGARSVSKCVLADAVLEACAKSGGEA
jgi:hypothetical protein